MNKKVCKVCGESLPLSAFHSWRRKDGSIKYTDKCTRCANREAYLKRKSMHNIGKALVLSDEEIIAIVKIRHLEYIFQNNNETTSNDEKSNNNGNDDTCCDIFDVGM